MEKATLDFRIHKIWQILKRFAGTFCRAQTLKLGGVIYVIFFPDQTLEICVVAFRINKLLQKIVTNQHMCLMNVFLLCKNTIIIHLLFIVQKKKEKMLQLFSFYYKKCYL